MRTISLVKAEAVGALVTVAGFFVGIALMASSGVQVLIPPTGKDGREWLADAQDAGDLFVAGASVTVLKTSAAPRWIGWVGIVCAIFAGWLGLLSPLSSIVEGISSIGFLAFFIFMASLGVAFLHRNASVEAPAGTA